MANVPRKHHYVPQVLLAGFTVTGTKTGVLHVVDVVRRATFTSTPQETAAERDYNLVEGLDPRAVEGNLFANLVEGPVAKSLELLRAGEIPDDEGRANLLSFVAMQALRVPARRDAYDDFMTQLARLTIDVATSSEQTFDTMKRGRSEFADLTREEVREFGRTIVAKGTPAGHLGTQLPSYGLLADLLARRAWAVLASQAGGPDFVCADDPVVLMPSGTRDPRAPRGFGSMDAQVFMPVGRRSALLGFWPTPGGPPASPAWGPVAIGARQVAALNAGVIQGAIRFVASAEPDFAWLRGAEIADRAAYLELLKSSP